MSDRLDWILSTPESERELADRYDEWAATYDADHAAWGWNGPAMAVSALAIALGGTWVDTHLVLDAGCGTGLVAQTLRDQDIDADVIGLDLSTAMLQQADATDCYRYLARASLYALPLQSRLVDAVVSTGVFTHGHVGPEALVELCRVTRPGGYVVVTLRVDIIETYASTVQGLIDSRQWSARHEFQPVRSHPDHNDTEQCTFVWQVS